MDLNSVDMIIDLGSRQVFLIIQMLQLPEKNICIFLAVNTKTVSLDYVIDVCFVTILSFLLVSAAPTFDSHWLEECANLRRHI